MYHVQCTSTFILYIKKKLKEVALNEFLIQNQSKYNAQIKNRLTNIHLLNTQIQISKYQSI